MPDQRLEHATLGGGCFWCLDGSFRLLRGVHEVISGYAAGHVVNPTYEQVCSATSGHAEVVRVVFDPTELSYRDLLEAFFAVHDPTTPNRQGNDVGPQYRSIILYHSPEQEQAAREMIAELERDATFGAPVVTQLEPAGTFYPAEGYHQDYFAKNPRQPYCQAVVAPKVAKLRRKMAEKIRA